VIFVFLCYMLGNCIYIGVSFALSNNVYGYVICIVASFPLQCQFAWNTKRCCV